MNTDLCVWDYAFVADWASETFSRSAGTCNGRPTCPHFSCMVCGLVRICKTHNEFWWWQYFKLIDKIKFLYVFTSFLYWPRCIATYRYVHISNIICAYLLHSHSSFLTITEGVQNFITPLFPLKFENVMQTQVVINKILCWHIYYDMQLHIIKVLEQLQFIMPQTLKKNFHCSNIYILDPVVLLHVLLQEDRLGELLCALPTRIGLHPLLLLSVLLHMLVKLTLLKFIHTI